MLNNKYHAYELLLIFSLKGYKIRGETFVRTSDIIAWFKRIMEEKLASQAIAAQTKATGSRKTRFNQADMMIIQSTVSPPVPPVGYGRAGY